MIEKQQLEKALTRTLDRTLWKVLVVFFLMSVVGIRYACFLIRNRDTPSANACIAVLAQIRNSKDTWAMNERKEKTAVPIWEDLVGREKYVRLMPQCPDGGVYTLRSVGEDPICSCGWTLPK